MSVSKPKLITPRFFISSLSLIATNYALRCDAKWADQDSLATESRIRKGGHFEVGEFLPKPFVKGNQHKYLDVPTDESVPVVNTLSIQNLAIIERDCQHIPRDDFDGLSNERRLNKGDVLLTVDGGVSIGKPVLFDLEDAFTVDSHVCILRPEGISPLSLVYLLASPIGQMQFRRAESGASGQTTVTEDDVRRFIFPRSLLKSLDSVINKIEQERQAIRAERAVLDAREANIWKKLARW